jgi:hypothetical protein
MRKLLATFALAVMMAFGAANAADAQQQRGLVNVKVGDVTVLENVAVGVAAQAIAQVCPTLQVGQVAVLATQVVRTGQVAETGCEAELEGESGPITIAPRSEGEPDGGAAQFFKPEHALR